MTDHGYSQVRRYNKLVRDKIPNLLESLGKPYKIHVADDAEFRQKLVQKLEEEVAEYVVSASPGELADIAEVILALAELHDLNAQQLEGLRIKKATERGGFAKRIILEES